MDLSTQDYIDILIRSGIGLSIGTVFLYLIKVILNLSSRKIWDEFKKTSETIEQIKTDIKEWQTNSKEKLDLEMSNKKEILDRHEENLKKIEDRLDLNCLKLKTLDSDFTNFKNHQEKICRINHR